MRARRLLGAVVAQGEEAGGIERIVEEEVTAAAALQYPRCYSTAGTVHGMRLGFGGLPAP